MHQSYANVKNMFIVLSLQLTPHKTKSGLKILANLSSRWFYAEVFVLVFYFNFANDHGCDFEPAKNVLYATKMLYTY